MASTRDSTSETRRGEAPADEAYLKQSILEPQSQVVNGFPPMSFNPQAMGITDLQVSNIIEYIKTLK